jgi:hypothetical protein
MTCTIRISLRVIAEQASTRQEGFNGFGQAGEVDATAHQKAEIEVCLRQTGPREGILERAKP